MTDTATPGMTPGLPTAMTETPEPTAETGFMLATLPPPEAGPETLELETLSAEPVVPDFHEAIVMEMSWTDPDDSPQQAGANYAYQQQSGPQPAWQLVYDDNNPFLPSSYNLTLTGEQGYSAGLDMPCQQVSQQAIQEQAPRASFEELFAALTGSAARSTAGADLDGQPVDAYTLQAENFKPGAEIQLKGSAANEEGEFTSTSTSTIALQEEGTTLESGTLYLAQQGGYAAKIELVFSKLAGEEDSPFAKSGSEMKRSVTYSFNPTLEAEDPILPPADCPIPTDLGGGTGGSGGGTGSSGGTGAGSATQTTEDTGSSGSGGGAALTIGDLPRLADATNEIQSDGSLVYQSALSFDEAVDFYRTEMEAQGWTAGDEITLGTIATLEYSRAGQSASITIIESGDGLMITVDLS